MKPLTKYLNPKSKWHPLEFPEDPTPEKLIQFFEEKKLNCIMHDYTEVYQHGNNTNEYFAYALMKAQKSSYMFLQNINRYWFRFAKYNKTLGIRKSNPIFSMYFKLDKQANYYELVGCHTCGKEIGSYEDFYGYEYEEFRNKVNTCFGW